MGFAGVHPSYKISSLADFHFGSVNLVFLTVRAGGLFIGFNVFDRPDYDY